MTELGPNDVVCAPADITLTTQEQVDELAEQRCTTITGDLYIGFPGDDQNPPTSTTIRTLEPLKCLKRITGDLVITQNLFLHNLHGLENLCSVGGDFFISNNPILESVSELKCLRNVGGQFMIAYNFSLAKIDGFNKLKSVGYTDISFNQSLLSVKGFCSLETTVGGGDEDTDGIWIYTNAALQKIDAFQKLITVTGDVKIYDNEKLKSIKGFYALQTVTHNLEINSNTILKSIQGFDLLQTIGFELQIYDNPLLKQISEFKSLVSASDIDFYGNTALKVLCGFDALQTVVDIAIGDVEDESDYENGVERICGFNSLTAVSGSLIISENQALKTIDGFRKLRSIGLAFYIEENPLLVSIDGFACLASIGEDAEDTEDPDEQILQISNNPLLTNLDGLIGVTYASGVMIFGNGSLLQLNGLSSLMDVGDVAIQQSFSDVEITGNPYLANFFGLQPFAANDPEATFNADDNAENPTKEQVAALSPPHVRDFFESALDRFVTEGANPSVINTLAQFAGCQGAIQAAVDCGGLTAAQANVLQQALAVFVYQNQLSSLPPKGPPLILQEPARSAKPNKALLFQIKSCSSFIPCPPPPAPIVH